jgi:hypothetical protein
MLIACTLPFCTVINIVRFGRVFVTSLNEDETTVLVLF